MEGRVIDSIVTRIREAIGEIGPALAFVDSPRAPRDLDCSVFPMTARSGECDGRMLDSALRELLRAGGIEVALSMFPTPRAEYFIRCAQSARCKPHLRAFARELIGHARADCAVRGEVSGGALFTRFMLSGFATFPALERMGMRPLECFPDLQFRLWSEGAELVPKRSRAEAIRVRRAICSALARSSGIEKFEAPQTLDQADAAVLALSAAAASRGGSIFELSCMPEGRFAVAMPAVRNPRA